MAASYRALREMDDPVEAIGELPPTGAAELREAWAAAARALEMREEESDVRAASQGQLEALVQAYERVASWAPEYVADRLEKTSVAAQNTKATARVAAAEANRSGLDRDRLRAERAAAQAEELDAKRALLEEIHAARKEWAEHYAPAQGRANEAALELTRREKAQEKVKVKVYPPPPDEGQPEAQQPEPQPGPSAATRSLPTWPGWPASASRSSAKPRKPSATPGSASPGRSRPSRRSRPPGSPGSTCPKPEPEADGTRSRAAGADLLALAPG